MAYGFANQGDSMIRVAVAAPNPILRAGLREILQGAEDIAVVAESSGLDEISRPAAGAVATGADVIVIALASAARIDISRIALNGEASPAILALTNEPADLGALMSLPAPAWGILPPDAEVQEIVAAIHALNEGLIVGNPRLLKPLTSRQNGLSFSPPEPLAEPLTDREREVLQRIAQGLANKQIAAALGISEHTVKFHLSSIYTKLGATNRTEAVRLGTLQGIIVL
jgi:DNA-binding NarL/FixJ family response regulator